MIISKINFPIYGFILLFSGILSIIYIILSLYKEKYKDKNIFLFIVMYIPFSFVFAKFYTIFLKSFTVDFANANLSSYGGFLGVVIASIIFEKILPLDNKLIKYTIISIPFTYGFAKIACFIVGCCCGIPYNGIFSVTYENDLNIPLFPIQIVETIVFLLMFLIFNKFKSKIDDKNIYYVIIVFALSKFLLDFFRYEHINQLITFNQIFSLLIIFVSILVLLFKYKKDNRGISK